MRNLFVGAVLALVSLSVAVPALAECRDDRVSLRGPGGQAGFTVEIADTDATRALGLMHRESMPRFSGMLFVFDRPQRAVFWMENTLIPLDMLFIDARGVVQRIHPMARPLDRTPIDGGPDILYVLEINGGMAEMLGLEPGAELRHPRIDPAQAAWPCE
ncbi:MAG: DUF192 domain-containing protein [Pararhodobacter sp.]